MGNKWSASIYVYRICINIFMKEFNGMEGACSVEIVIFAL